MDNTTPRPKPQPPKVGPHAPKPVEVAPEEKPEERCLCGRYLSQISEGCVFGKHKRPYVAKPHLTERPFKDNPELLKLKSSMSTKQNRKEKNR